MSRLLPSCVIVSYRANVVGGEAARERQPIFGGVAARCPALCAYPSAPMPDGRCPKTGTTIAGITKMGGRALVFGEWLL